MAFRSGNDRSADGGPEEAAHYLAGAVAELAQIARRHQLDMLGYLLDMAHLEAEDLVRRSGGPNGQDYTL